MTGLRAPFTTLALRRTVFCVVGVVSAATILTVPAIVPALGVLVLWATGAMSHQPTAPVAPLFLILFPLTVALLVVLAAPIGRATGAAHRWIAERLLDVHVPAPPPRPSKQARLSKRIIAVVSDGPGWRALGYGLLKVPLAIPEGYGAFCYVFGLVNLSYPVWWPLFRNHPPGTRLGPVWALTPFGTIGTRTFAGTFLIAAAGLAMLQVAPWLMRAGTTLDIAAMRRLLGPRRLAERVRGIHPPVLDNGLGDALATLATGSAIPVAVNVELTHRPSPARSRRAVPRRCASAASGCPAIETIAYFCAAELLANAKQPFPVLLYSPGAGDPRTWETTVVQDLASRGYLVVTIDHTYDSSEVEFPDGRVVDSLLEQLFREAQQPDAAQTLATKIFDVRIADTRFVLDQLAALGRGANPDADDRPIPAGVAGALDLRRIGMIGVSAGGLTAFQSMDQDPRIKAAADIGGNIESPLIPDPIRLWPVARHGLDQPFMFIGDPGTDHQTPSWKMLWDNSRGWHVDVHLNGAKDEDSYKDTVPLIPQIARQLGLPGEFVTGVAGSIDLTRAVHTEETFVAAFFDRWLRGRNAHVLDGPSPHFPDVTFVP